jgi:hypothetical protein
MQRKKNSLIRRKSVAELAAKLMAEEGITNHFDAKRKAAERLGLGHERELPDNHEIESCLLQYQRLFQDQTQANHLHDKRKTALAAMRMLTAFSPRLVGPVLSGTAGEHTAITLHLFTDTPEEVGWLLTEQSIPHQFDERRLRRNANTAAIYPCYQFMAGDTALELVVFPHKEIRQAPLSPLDGKPMRRVDWAALQSLVDEACVQPEQLPP